MEGGISSKLKSEIRNIFCVDGMYNYHVVNTL